MDLKIWVDTNRVENEMLWKGAAERQCDRFLEWASVAARAEVVSQHRSKSINLPVVLLTYANGAKAQIRDNFHDYKVTIWSPKPIALPDSVDGTTEIHDVYCEGFPAGTVIGPHAKDQSAFTVELYRDSQVTALLAAVAS